MGVLDSGTTFTYVPHKLFNMFVAHFDWFCDLDHENHCKGKRVQYQDDICFEYSESAFPEGPKDYFMSYPVLNFKTIGLNGEHIDIKWFPSEYLFRQKSTRYCMAIEKFSRSNEVLLGGSFMRQNNFIFDVENNKIGFARARCNDDPNFIESEQEMIVKGH